jgi:hypothetical protein
MPRMAPRAASCAKAGRPKAHKKRQSRKLRLNTPKDPYCDKFGSNRGNKACEQATAIEGRRGKKPKSSAFPKREERIELRGEEIWRKYS